ncbi:MAG: hypothetical protein E6R03_03860 [Hyphomicrobiaceae bacterium]|nr:MAG: hypothetical protein E6R03_03860 [Hyphomicrobiaceae bacterium]
MGYRAILPSDQPFLIRRNGVIIAGSEFGTPITGGGPSKPVGRFSDKRVQFSGAFTGGWSVTLEGTVDGTNWIAIQAAIVAAPAAPIEVAPWWLYLRLNTLVVGTLVSTNSPWGVADQPAFRAFLGGRENIEG